MMEIRKFESGYVSSAGIDGVTLCLILMTHFADDDRYFFRLAHAHRLDISLGSQDEDFGHVCCKWAAHGSAKVETWHYDNEQSETAWKALHEKMIEVEFLRKGQMWEE